MNISKNWMRAGVACLALALIAFAATPARADGPISFTISVPNVGLSGTPGPYATVTLTLSGSTIHVAVVGAAGFTFFGSSSGNNSMFGFNVVGSTTGLAISNCTATGTSTANGCGVTNGIQDRKSVV